MEMGITVVLVAVGFIAVAIADNLIWEWRNRRAERLAREWHAERGGKEGV